MVTILFAIFSIFASRFRSRTTLELKLVALEHQLAVLRVGGSNRSESANPFNGLAHFAECP